MRVCLKECKDAELVRSSVPIARENDMYENTQPEIENCSDGIAPQPNTAVDGSQKMIAPVVVSMTKYLFAHYRLQMYAYVKRTLFYLEDLINERELDEIDAEQQFKPFSLLSTSTGA